MEMPNTVPNTLTQELLQDKYDIAERDSYVNYSFYMGASNDNLDEVLKTDPATVCGIKAFLGSSTGNMLVDDEDVLYQLFGKCHMLIATHCEDESRIRQRTRDAIVKWGDDIPITAHPDIRDHEACYLSSSRAVRMAKELGTRLHVLHISTAKELELFDKGPLESKQITAEACIHHLWFNLHAYEQKGAYVKWNPAIKEEADRVAILQAVVEDRIDIIATDHAPHTISEKSNPYLECPSGGPMVQHAVPVMFELVRRGSITKEQVVEKMCHAPARLFGIEKRGYLKEGNFADVVLLRPESPWAVQKDDLLYSCGWSPLEGTGLSTRVEKTFVNGNLVYENGLVYDKRAGMRMRFNR
jgi:dihydroorotase